MASEQSAPAAQDGGEASMPAASSAQRSATKGWGFVWNATFVLGALLAVNGGLIMGHFFGFWVAVAWTIPCVALLMAVIYYAMRDNEGDKSAGWKYPALHAVVIVLWMGSAVALWLTGNPSAWVNAVMIPASWSIHVIFSGQRNPRILGGLIALCVLPMLGFMLWATWAEYPLWMAIPGSLASVFMVMSIVNSAKYSNDNFIKLQQTLDEAAATRARLEFAIQSAGDGYFEIDFATMHYTPNAALARMIQFEAGRKSMEEFRAQVHPDDAEETIGHLMDTIEGRSAGWRQEFRLRTPNGYSWMLLRAQVIESERGSSRKLIGTVVDMTAWKTLEAELRAAKEIAENSSRAKSQFLANMSHEIRTPLNGVLGMAQALEQDELEPTQKEKVSIILDSGKSLMSLLNDVLDLSKIEAGKLEISPVPGDFLHTMKRTRQLFQTTAEDKGLDLMVRYDSNFPQRLSYDPVRVRQCVGNLLSNAIKFTAKGRVEVGISAKRQADGQFMVMVDVVDTGIGMSRETIDKLFTVFSQADGATTRKFGGSGLGLAISRQLARMMGGDLTVESEEGRGSTFRLSFKAAGAAPAANTAPARSAVAAAEPQRRSLRGTRLLLTDDNAVNRQVIKLFLAPQGLDIVEAQNGKEALDKLSTQEFDIVLLDVHMPVMDGKEAIQRIRAAGQKWSQVPVIALTADAMSGDREKYLALGMTDYLSKPVDQRELVAKLHFILGLGAQAAAKTGT